MHFARAACARSLPQCRPLCYFLLTARAASFCCIFLFVYFLQYCCLLLLLCCLCTCLGTITSLTFQHYYLKAVSRCLYFGTPADVVYCHQLANLCVLQLYDDTSLACIAHKNIIAQRGTNTFNSIDNWVTGQPWIFFSGEANAVCNTFAFKKRVTLNSLTMHYLLVTYYMNGTFAGTMAVHASVRVCT